MNIVKALNHYFLPAHTNNFRARLLHSPVLILIALALVILQLSLSILSSSKVRVLGYAANISPQKVIELTNKMRAESGAPELKFNQALSDAARQKGLDMLEYDYWAHTSPNGTEPWDFFRSEGYTYRYAGENLARDFENPEATVTAWMASPSHKENILSTKYKEIGVAVVEGDLAGKDTTLVIQFFGTASTDRPTVSVAAASEDIKVEPADKIETKPEILKVEVPEVVTPVIKANSFNLMRTLTIGVIFAMATLLVLDIIIIKKRQITRTGGRTFAHLSFMAMVLIILIIARVGEII